MKKVAFIAPTYPVLSETFIQTEVESIKACGHEVMVFAFDINKSEQRFDYDLAEIAQDVDWNLWTQISQRGLLKAMHFVYGQVGLPKRSLFYYGLKLAMQLAEKKVDHVHAHFAQHTAAHAIVAARLLNISCSFVAHGHDVYEAAFDIKNKIEASDFVVAVCQDMLNDFDNVARGNVKLLHCGVTTDKFILRGKQPSSHLRLVFLGRLVEQKGVHHLIEALASLKDRVEFQLDIVGTGDMEEDLIKQVSEHGLSKRVTFLGAKPHDWVKEHLADYDCLVAPFCFSKTGCVDTGPLVLKEAMAVGTPVITTNIMGCKEIVTPETGYLVDEQNVQQLATSLAQFARLTFQERLKMGYHAHKRVVDSFNAYVQAKRLSGWIESV
ncbi:colanic acid biosynthesis glycosyltransferase WcaL [Enterovibrio norvegicus FF-33]|uniref:glycosyltransferase family 4 protein n=1 Tax=Enterovibrio norvegicus TaxID=188144 RepID=UPI0002D4FADA|nr:glycosyltransferase family 4 protein [Enterovibrio norvegicus]OEE65957.1 colanic acid biosynthesis glycosyltransferase WcaL [Enterovibrio norvegicus FF-33]